MTDYAAFQRLCDELLSAYWGYKIHPRGISAHGTVPGQPDSWAHDASGDLCALAYGAGSGKKWTDKLREDLEAVTKIADPNFPFKIFVFCTTQYIDPDLEREWLKKVQEEHNWELRLIGQGELAVPLDTTWQDIRERHLGIPIQHHNWTSLLAACEKQRQTSMLRHQGKYDSALYVSRRAEQVVETWYHQATAAISQSNGKAQLLALVDQAGAGKSSFVLHVAELYGKVGPVLIIPGNITIENDHTLEQELVEVVGYPIDGRTYHAKLAEVCQIAQGQGHPLLVILDEVDKNRSPELIRRALGTLLLAYREYPLLVLMTCRDAIWPHIQDPLWQEFIDRDLLLNNHSIKSEDGAVPLGLYDDEEYDVARERYFNHWNVEGSPGPKAVQVLRSPLLLRVFAEVSQNRKLGFIAEIAASNLWNQYKTLKIQEIYEGMHRRLRPEAIEAVIGQLALRFFERDSPVLSISEFDGIPSLNPNDNSADGLFVQLKNAAVLLENPAGTLQFVYDVFLDFMLASALAQQFKQSHKRETVLDYLEALSNSPRWRQVPLYLAELVSEPATILNRLHSCNLWLAAEAFRRIKHIGIAYSGDQIIEDLVQKLKSPYKLDRQRASTLLSLLGASESKNALLECWSTEHLEATLRALARLGIEEVVEPFTRYLGRFFEFYLPHDQELVDALPSDFRQSVLTQALKLLGDQEQADIAAQALGYLRSSAAVDPLLSFFRATEWTDWVALSAIFHIGTPEAFDALEVAINECGIQISLANQVSKQEEVLKDQQSTEPKRDHTADALHHLRLYGFQHSPPKQVVPLLTRLLVNPNAEVRGMAIHSLGILGAAETALDIVKAADSGWSGLWIDNALRAFGTQIQIEPFLSLIRDSTSSDTVMSYAIQAIGLSRDPRALAPLQELINQKRFLHECVRGLGDSKLPEACQVLARILLNSPEHKRKNKTDTTDDIDKFWVIQELGRLHHPAAFVPLEIYLRQQWPQVSYSMIDALVASDAVRALPHLLELWPLADSERKRLILGALLWVNSTAASTAIWEMLQPVDADGIALLVRAIRRGRGLSVIGGTRFPIGPVDDRLVNLVEDCFDRLEPADQRDALWAFADVATPRARQMLERIASDPLYDTSLPGATPNTGQTFREEATDLLIRLGSSTTVDAVLDQLPVSHIGIPEDRLAKMDRVPVIAALQHRLHSAKEPVQIQLFELLGRFGDQSALTDIRAFIDDPSPAIANAAYETEQRILGLADVY